MIIEMTVSLSGPAYLLEPGDRRDFPQDEALRLVAAGFAVPVSEPQIERAVSAPAVETRSDFVHRKHKHRR
ncbi:hypothetical protein ABIE88_008540 [Bradyrhizobium diazoefficiens]|uniref:hypothetical protein n=1 Tax=Bradyrhizobium TaxID=374 RepID=UPI0031841C2A